jgi:glycosyltransferase involved in cell wall biosynthesis
MTKFSIIIPVRRITDYLKESIPHIKRLVYTDFEVIVITDEDEHYDFQDARFVQIAVGKLGPAEKRNLGAKKATGDILVFIDDDAFPDKMWLSHAEEIFRDPSVYALGGPALTPVTATFMERMCGRVLESWLTSGDTIFRQIPQPERKVDDYPSVNLFVRKEAFDKVGGFYQEFWPGEDTKLCLDLVKNYGKKFLYSPLPVVYHHRRTLYIPHLKQISRYGQHRGQFARIFPENSRTVSYFIPSVFVIGLVLGGAAAFFVPVLKDLYIEVVGLYLLLVVVESVRAALKDGNLKTAMYVAPGIILTHIVYGFNFIIGFIRRPKLQLKAVDLKTGNYSEG